MTRLSFHRVAVVAVVVAVIATGCLATSSPLSTAPPISNTVPKSALSTTTTLSDGYAIPTGFDLQGHRGARGLKPENTLPAFETALDLGVTTLEFDLHLSADDEIVIWHDPVIDPAKCGLQPGAPSDVPDPDDPSVPIRSLAIRSLTVEQLSWYRCDRNPEPARFDTQDGEPTDLAGSSYSIVTLDELIDFVERYAVDGSKTPQQRQAAAAVRYNMETKRTQDPEAIGDGFDGENAGLFELRVLEIIEDRGIGTRTTVQSFDIRSLRAIRAVESELELAFLESRATVSFEDMAAWRIDIWSPNYLLATSAAVSEAHDLGLVVKPWTIESVDQAVAVIEAGVDGLITDRPDLFSAGY